MENYAIVNRAEFTLAFEPPKMKRAPAGAKSAIPKTSVLRGLGNQLSIEGAFVETILTVEGKWKTEIELKTTEVYELLKKRLPKSEFVTIYINESGKFAFQIDKLVVTINTVKT